MKAVIIEDEKIAAAHLADMLHDTGKEIEVVATLDSVKKSVEWLRNNTADLIFMDIQLGDDLSFSIFEQLEVKTPVIFTTAYDHYALKAFKVTSIDYLLKPIEKKELLFAISKYEDYSGNRAGNIAALLHELSKPAPEYQSRFMVSAGNRIRSVETSLVTCFYAEGRYVSMLLADGTRYLTDYTMEKLENLLDPKDFFRVNRSTIIRFSAIGQMHSYTKSRIKIQLKPETPFDIIVSIDRSGDFKKWLNR